MTLGLLLLLAVIQGATEFIPISSSAHLVFVQEYFELGESMLFVDVFLHVATLFAVFIVYQKDLREMIRSIFQGLNRQTFRERLGGESGLRSVYLIAVASVPTAAIGLGFHDQLKASFESPAATGLQLVVTGFLLWATGWRRAPGVKSIRSTTTLDAFWIGVLQGISILPGISRSGITIFGALLLGLQASWAARFSFLMSIPAIIGAILVESRHANFAELNWMHLSYAFVLALVVGIVSLYVVIRSVEKGQFRAFSYYAIPVGLFAWAYFTYWR